MEHETNQTLHSSASAAIFPWSGMFFNSRDRSARQQIILYLFQNPGILVQPTELPKYVPLDQTSHLDKNDSKKYF